MSVPGMDAPVSWWNSIPPRTMTHAETPMVRLISDETKKARPTTLT